AYVTSANELTLDLPDIVFNDHLTIYGSKRNVELITYGEGHTESDLFLYLPDDHIAFLGDLLFINNQPWTGDGDPIKWTSYLSQISHLDIKWIVPGHGPVGTLADITPMEGYFQNVEDAARSFHEKGISPDTIQKINSPPPYDSWFLSNFYKSNVISEYHRIFPK
ncbi:MAG: MBL fold metallo-hydrolase, partial [Saprospiraceae bacterium]